MKINRFFEIYLQELIMRLLNKRECKIIGGGEGGKPPVLAPFVQQSPTVQFFEGGGWLTTVVCRTPFAAGAQVVMNGYGKAFVLNAGGNAQLPQDCTITTLNEKTGVERICDASSKECTTYDKDGHKLSDISNDFNGDTGLEALWSSTDAYDGPDDLLVGGDAHIFESGTEPGIQPAAITNGNTHSLIQLA
ncbi:hypothetical protein NHH82_28905 [Oxalobacteraceae bacterium OTU3REALA1]|nr:hypothetical protein NHH82_28905 [Oxalobacteraceae bacterium OTU3REALA1]